MDALVRTMKGDLAYRVRTLFMVFLLMVSQVVSALAPVAAHAATRTTATVTNVEYYSDAADMEDHGIRSHKFTDTDGVVMYCSDAAMDTPSDGMTYTSSEPGGLTLDYILYYGYGGQGYRGSIQGYTDEDAQAITQLAVWAAIDGVDSYHTYQARRLWDVALSYYNEAVANAKADAVYAGTSLIYSGQPEGVQRIVGQTIRVGDIELYKTSQNCEMSDNNSSYSLAGAVYGIYSDAECTKLVASMTTDESGHAKSAQLPVGTYWVKETTSPKGYALSDSVNQVSVTSGTTSRVDVVDIPQHDPTFMKIQKIDSNTGLPKPAGKATLAGAEFTVKYYAGQYDENSLPETPARQWILKTDEAGITSFYLAYTNPDTYLVKGDNFYLNSINMPTLPLGTVTIQETKAPKGYKAPDGTVYLHNITGSGTVESVMTGAIPEVAEDVVRGDLEFVKVDGEKQNRIGNVAFLVESVTTGEAHVIVTDANGSGSTATSHNPHSTSTNANDAAWDGHVLDESKLNPEAGVWFSGAKDVEGKVDDALGALPFDTYRITELQGTANAGYKLVSTTVEITRDGQTLNHGTVSNWKITVETPSIDSVATDAADGDHIIDAAPDQKVRDRISYEGYEVGKTYHVKDVLHMRDSNGNDAGVLTDKAGNPVVVETDFTPTEKNGFVDLTHTVDATELAGSTLVAFAEVSCDGEIVATHADINDEEQTVRVATKPTSPKPPMPSTGEPASIAAAVAAAGAALSAAGFALYRHKAKKETN